MRSCDGVRNLLESQLPREESPNDRVPASLVIKEIEQLANQNVSLYAENEKCDLEASADVTCDFSFDFSKLKGDSDSDTTLAADDVNVTDEDSPLPPELDEFMALLESCAKPFIHKV
ncbi:hypothetical protein BdWA1_003275 [Babesia duncani]|uniref:Uncharacterized protein n=1 Tax=Babesia duncani TaxID=323732 RepID=A0AAD9PJM4_9APIC|nr:hypothetical protein BdWA1_003275 [Babesia duncani]